MLACQSIGIREGARSKRGDNPPLISTLQTLKSLCSGHSYYIRLALDGHDDKEVVQLLKHVRTFDPTEDIAFEFDVSRIVDHKSLAVRWGAREVLTYERPSIRHVNYPFTFIKYVVRGSGVFHFGGGRVALTPGMAFWSKEKTLTRLEITEEGLLVNYVIMLFGEDLARLRRKYLHESVCATELHDPRQIEAIMEDLILEGQGASDCREENCTDLAMVLLRRLDSNIVSIRRPNKLARRTYWRCKRYIEANFAHINELGQVADACSVTVPYLCRLFDQFDDLRPYQYITTLKMSKAQRLLTTTQDTVTDIARALSYKDLQLFSRNFKIVCGKSPSRYRKDHA